MLALLLGSLAICAAFTYYFLPEKGRSRSRYPPSPTWSVPLLGHLPFLGLEPHKLAISWIPKYGPIVSLRFGSFPAIIISDYKLIKEAYSLPSFAGRPKFQYFLDRSGSKVECAEGIVGSYGRTANEQRAFTHKRLREIGGFGTRSMETLIMEQVQQFVERLKTEVGVPTSTQHRFYVPVVNSLWAIIAGKPFEQDDPEVHRVTKITMDGLAEASTFVMLAMFLPWMAHKYLPNWITRKSDFEKQYKPLRAFVKPYIDEHYATKVPGNPPRDFIDAYIDKINRTTDPSSSFFGDRGKNSLLTTILDLFMAGADTVATTLAWICLLSASYPDVQEKAVLEIKREVGSSAAPTLAHRKSLPYTEALIHEVMRHRILLPLGAMHSTVEDVELGGFTIPKDTMVFINIDEVHLNKEIWGEDAADFRPERWLSEDGTEFVRHDGFIPFSVGKRVCLGEQMGRDELFLFTTSLLQAFRIELDPNCPAPSLDPRLGGSVQDPKPETKSTIFECDIAK